MDLKLEESINFFKNKFGQNCRILENIGDFRYIITLHSPLHKGNIKFQITGKNKVTLIVSGFGSWDQFIEEEWNSNTYSLVSIVEKAIDIIDANLSNDETIDNNKNVLKKAFNKKKLDEEKKVKTKLKMKTSEDVIKRIVWDDNLHPMDFTIGYLDRFIGIVEKNFSSFSWEDLASVDQTVLAIPKHRIQYFLYKGEKVWDKKIKLDNVFGSTGSGITILDVVACNDARPFLIDGMLANDNAVDGKHIDNRLTRRASDDDDEDNSDSDDDGIQINLDSKIAGISSLRANEVYFKTRPNYFLCQRITDPEIVSNFAIIQKILLERNPLYGQYFINPEMLHMTLCTLGLYTDEQVDQVKHILEENQLELNSLVGSGIKLTIAGVGQFIERVVYAKVEAEPRFWDFVNALKLMILESGLSIKDNYEFTPHVTVMKLKFDKFRTAEIQTIPKDHYLEHRDVYFGNQCIDGIYLCSMTHERDTSGFYLSPAHIPLPGNTKNS